MSDNVCQTAIDDEFLEQILFYPPKKKTTETYSFDLNFIETEHGYNFINVDEPMLARTCFYREGQNIFKDNPVHVIPDWVLLRMSMGEKAYIYICEECVKTQKVSYPITDGDITVYSERVEDSPYLGKIIVFRTELDDGRIMREGWCTREPSHSFKSIENNISHTKGENDV